MQTELLWGLWFGKTVWVLVMGIVRVRVGGAIRVKVRFGAKGGFVAKCWTGVGI